MNEVGEQIRGQAEKVRETYEEAERSVRQLGRDASEKSKAALTFTDEWVHRNPWLALGIVAGVGLLIGLLAGHGSSSDD